MQRAAQWLLAFVLALAVTLPAQIRAQANPTNQELFPLLPGLEHRVEFWKKIFTEYSISQLVFFDAVEMTTIYEVQDVGENSRTNEFINSERSRIAAAHGVDIDRVKAQRGIRERTEAGIKRSGRHIEYI